MDGNYSLVIINTSAEKHSEKQVSQVPKTSQRHSFPPFPRALEMNILLQIFMNLITLSTLCKWNHTVFVLL